LVEKGFQNHPSAGFESSLWKHHLIPAQWKKYLIHDELALFGGLEKTDGLETKKSPKALS
jgi:hypothetical protein